MLPPGFICPERDEIISLLSKEWFVQAEHNYLKYHAQRIADTLRLIAPIIEGRGARILDIGPHMLTFAFHHYFKHLDPQISTIGWENHRLAPKEIIQFHLQHDLNSSIPQGAFPFAPFDGIIMAETIEHLYTSPRVVLKRITEHLRIGGWLLLQTPNAVSVRKRITMLCGKNPYEMIRDNSEDPGHFREYTSEELVKVGSEIGLVAEQVLHMNYWRSRGIYGYIEGLFPSTRNGLTVIFRKKPPQ